MPPEDIRRLLHQFAAGFLRKRIRRFWKSCSAFCRLRWSARNHHRSKMPSRRWKHGGSKTRVPPLLEKSPQSSVPETELSRSRKPLHQPWQTPVPNLKQFAVMSRQPCRCPLREKAESVSATTAQTPQRLPILTMTLMPSMSLIQTSSRSLRKKRRSCCPCWAGLATMGFAARQPGCAYRGVAGPAHPQGQCAVGWRHASGRVVPSPGICH